MHRIDGAGATPANKFTEGDPDAGVPATTVTDDWLNTVQEELAAVATSGGAALSKANNGQVLAAIKALVADAIPSGMIAPFHRATAFTGWLACDGQTVSRTTYADLFAVLGTDYNTGGEAATVFRLPDLRGEFIRGADSGRGVDAGRVLGSSQADSIKLHGHPFRTAAGNENTDDTGGIAMDVQGTQVTRAAWTGEPDSIPTRLIGGFGGDETRPRNVALRYFIKT